MNIRSAEFVKGIKGTDEILTDGVPQVAFVGRSNVGKSSMINSLTNKTDLVKTGKKPGKTKELNFFSINNRAYYFVDLPGYGYAEMRPEEKEKIQKLIFWYLTGSGAKPVCVVVILDVKAGLTDYDKEMLQLLREQKHPYLIVTNKIDKVNQKEASAALTLIKKEAHEAEIATYSSVDADGRDKEALLAKILG